MKLQIQSFPGQHSVSKPTIAMQEYFGLCFYWFWTSKAMFESVIIWVKCRCDCISVGRFQQCQFNLWNERIATSPPRNGNSFFNGWSFPCPRVCFEVLLRVCSEPSFFEVQVNISWWLAVWSQEVASARGVMARRCQWRN